MITILVNDQAQQLEPEQSLQDTLLSLGYRDPTVAVAVNQTFVAKAHYKKTIINADDVIDIVAPMQGG